MPFFLEANYRVSWFLIMLAYAVVLLGACIGGVIAFLLNRQSMAAATGALATILLLLIEDRTHPEETSFEALVVMVIAVFLIFTVGGFFAACHFEETVQCIVTSTIGSLLIITGLNPNFQASVINSLEAILLSDYQHLGCEDGTDCSNVLWGIIAWPCGSVLFFFVQVGGW